MRKASTRLLTSLLGGVGLALAQALASAPDAHAQSAPPPPAPDMTTAILANAATKKPPVTRDLSIVLFDFYFHGGGMGQSLSGYKSTAGADYSTGMRGFYDYRSSGSIINAKIDYDVAVGGGDYDLSGVLRNYYWVGIEPKTHDMRGFARLGVGGEYRSSQAFLYSHLDTPALELGAIVPRGLVTFEGGGLLAWTATGRFDVGNGTERKMDGAASWGGYFAMKMTEVPVFVRADLRQYYQEGYGFHLTEAGGRACIFYGVSFCLDGMTASGLTTFGAEKPLDANLYYAGFSLGLGYVSGPGMPNVW